MKPPKLSKSGVPMIPMNEVMSWEDWLKGRRAPRREFSSSDKRLRELYNGEPPRNF